MFESDLFREEFACPIDFYGNANSHNPKIKDFELMRAIAICGAARRYRSHLRQLAGGCTKKGSIKYAASYIFFGRLAVQKTRGSFSLGSVSLWSPLLVGHPPTHPSSY